MSRLFNFHCARSAYTPYIPKTYNHMPLALTRPENSIHILNLSILIALNDYDIAVCARSECPFHWTTTITPKNQTNRTKIYIWSNHNGRQLFLTLGSNVERWRWWLHLLRARARARAKARKIISGKREEEWQTPVAKCVVTAGHHQHFFGSLLVLFASSAFPWFFLSPSRMSSLVSFSPRTVSLFVFLRKFDYYPTNKMRQLRKPWEKQKHQKKCK